MKKLFYSVLGVGFVSSLLIGGMQVSAADTNEGADPATSKTPLTAKLEASSGTNPLPPDPDTVTPTDPTGNFGIAYIPKAFSFEGELEAGALSLPDTSGKPSHVAVKDTTFNKKGWDLTASVNWTAPIEGATINMNVGSVKVNRNDGTSPFKPSDLITPESSLSGAFSTPTTKAILNSSPANIIEAKDGFIYTDTYDVEVSNVSLEIADGSKVAAGTYAGNIDWNLAIKP